MAVRQKYFGWGFRDVLRRQVTADYYRILSFFFSFPLFTRHGRFGYHKFSTLSILPPPFIFFHWRVGVSHRIANKLNACPLSIWRASHPFAHLPAVSQRRKPQAYGILFLVNSFRIKIINTSDYPDDS